LKRLAIGKWILRSLNIVRAGAILIGDISVPVMGLLWACSRLAPFVRHDHIFTILYCVPLLCLFSTLHLGWSRRLKELIMNHLFMPDIVTYSMSLWIGHISKRILGMTIFSVFSMVRTPIDRAVQWTLRILWNFFASINSVIQLINGRQRNAEIPVYRLMLWTSNSDVQWKLSSHQAQAKFIIENDNNISAWLNVAEYQLLFSTSDVE